MTAIAKAQARARARARAGGVDAQRRPEDVTVVGAEQLPRCDQVDAGVAERERAEVEHGGKAAVADEDILSE